MPEKPEMTREQHARIESLANEHGGVKVYPPDENLIVKVEFAGRTMMLNEDGDETIPPLDSIALRLPTDLVKRLLGADVVDDEIVSAADASYRDYRVGSSLQSAIEARIAELLDMSTATVD